MKTTNNQQSFPYPSTVNKIKKLLIEYKSFPTLEFKNKILEEIEKLTDEIDLENSDGKELEEISEIICDFVLLQGIFKLINK